MYYFVDTLQTRNLIKSAPYINNAVYILFGLYRFTCGSYHYQQDINKTDNITTLIQSKQLFKPAKMVICFFYNSLTFNMF